VTGRVAVLCAPERFELREAEAPAAGAAEVVVRVQECGICGSDLKMWAGTHAFMRPPIVMGHEIVGVVEEVGAGVEVAPGTTVTVFPPVGCGACFHCESGHDQLCEAMEFFGGQRAGGLADYVVVPASHVLPIPDAVPHHVRVLIEPLSVAVHAVVRGSPAPDDRCVVLGAGSIGFFTALVLRHSGVGDVVVSDVLPDRRRRAEETGFATIDPTSEPLREAVRRTIRPEGADAVYECVGSQPTIADALSVTRKRGKTVIVGNAPSDLRLDGLAIQRGDRSLIGVLMYDLEDFRTAMRLLADGLMEDLEPATLVARYRLDRVAEAFRAAKLGTLSGLKAVVEL
jgi:2-desacetyl-2-hydroxyethyl bacteriochlorophyllide A dehydrogenase